MRMLILGVSGRLSEDLWISLILKEREIKMQMILPPPILLKITMRNPKRVVKIDGAFLDRIVGSIRISYNP